MYKAISEHRGFKTLIQVFNNFSNILWDKMVFQNTVNYGVLPQMHYLGLTVSQLRIVDFFVHY